MNKLAYFRFVEFCHTMRNQGYSVEKTASRLSASPDDVRLALESSPVGASPHG